MCACVCCEAQAAWGRLTQAWVCWLSSLTSRELSVRVWVLTSNGRVHGGGNWGDKIENGY